MKLKITWERRLMRISSIFAVAIGFCLNGSGAAAQESCELVTVYVGTDGSCGSNSVYVGPWSQADHGGTCLVAVGCEITARQIRNDKNCGDGTYIGPEEVTMHGGYCAQVTGDKFTLVARETNSRESCSSGWQYAGANLPDMHGGHCIRIFGN